MTTVRDLVIVRWTAAERVAYANQGVDLEASWFMVADMDAWAAAHPCDCEALCVCEDAG